MQQQMISGFPYFLQKKHLLHIEIPLFCKVSCVRQACFTATQPKQAAFEEAFGLQIISQGQSASQYTACFYNQNKQPAQEILFSKIIFKSQSAS